MSEVSLGRLRFAIKKKKNEEVYAILDRFGMNATYEGLGSALSIACMTQNWEIAKYCIENGADVNMRDSEDGTALIDACVHGNLEITKMLVEAGAEINAANKYDKRSIAKVIANQSSNYDLIEYLLENGADPFVEEEYMKSDSRRETYTAYDYAKQEVRDEKLMDLLDKYKK